MRCTQTMIGLALTRPRYAGLAPLAITAALAVLGSAVVCGVLANPHDRYGARMVWLASFVVTIALWHLGFHQPPAALEARQAG